MSMTLLLAAAAVVFALTAFLLRVSGAGRELFGRDSWMLGSRGDSEGLQRSSGAFIEDHEFWSLENIDERDFWEEMPADEDDEGTGGLAAVSGD